MWISDFNRQLESVKVIAGDRMWIADSQGPIGDPLGPARPIQDESELNTVLNAWLPIVLSAVIVFVASSIMHMLLPYHRSDYRQLMNPEIRPKDLGSVSPGGRDTPNTGFARSQSPL